MAPDAPAIATSRKTRASVTLVTLCLMTALAIALGSYIALCSRSAQLSTRTISSDQSLQLAQTGLEEALWALNQNSWASSGPASNTVWSTSGANRTVTLTYTLPSPHGTGQVVLTIADYASTGPTWPTITSAATLTLPSGETFTKTLQAATGPAPLFANAIASSDSYVSFTDRGTVDSWNSDPDNDSSTAMVPYSFAVGNASNYNAVIAGRTDNAGTYGVILTNATVNGYVTTFGLPISYSTSGSPMAKVVGPLTATGTNVDPTRLGKSAFVPTTSVFTVSLPATSGPYYGGVVATVVNLVTKLLSVPTFDTFKTGSGGLDVDALNPVTITRPIKIIVDGDLKIEPATLFLPLLRGKITISGAGSLQLFVSGDVIIDGDGFDNQTNQAKNLAIYCTGTGTSPSISYLSDKPFCGVIYAENRAIDIQQNGPFYGALLSRQSIRFRGSATNPTFHYDAALRKTKFGGIDTPYIISRLTEL